MSFDQQYNAQIKKLIKQKKLSQATELLAEILEQLPDSKFHQKQLRKLKEQEEQELETLQKLFKLGKYDEALKKCKIALIRFPNSALLNNFSGGLSMRLGMIEPAITSYEKTISLLKYDTNVLINLGIAYRNDQQFEKSLSCFTTILDRMPDHADARYSLAFTQLLLGNYHEGWKNYESRWQASFSTSKARSFHKPMWDGTPLNGKRIFVHCEQGYGDTFQFIRFIKKLKTFGGTIIFETPKVLEPLMFNFPEIDELIVRGQPEPAFDYHIPLLSLPYVFNLTLDELPFETSYITSDGKQINGLVLDKKKLNIGLVWTGSETFRHNHFRSMHFKDLAPLLETKNCVFHSLQVCETQKVVQEVLKEAGLCDLGSGFHSFLDTVRAIEEMDLIITTDTSVAHLAGAMGKKSWVLLHATSDFRWLVEREDSPWYPNTRLFRQKELGNWSELLQRVSSALHSLTNK